MRKTFLNILFVSAFFLLLPLAGQAATCDLNTVIDFVARDPDGAYIANAYVDIYKQELDVNGDPKPTTRFASDTTDATLGYARLSFRNSDVASDTYAIKVRVVNKDAAAFWFYDNTFACGESVSMEKILSGISFTLHDAEGNTLKEANFGIYSQVYSGTSPVDEKKEHLITLKTGYTGQAKVYLPQGSVRGLSQALSDHYAIEISRSSGKFNHFDIAVRDGRITDLNYYLSALRIRLQNADGSPYPPNTKVEVYEQIIGYDNERAKGDKMGDFTISDDGYGEIEIVDGVYVLAVKGDNNQYQYFWDIEAESGKTTEHTVTADQTWTPSEGTCQNNSEFSLVVQDFSGNTVSSLRYELYEQEIGNGALPIPGKKVSGGSLDSYGRGSFNFKPDPRKSYAIKIWEKRADLGEYWFFDAVKFVCDYNRSVTKVIPALRVTLRDADGNLKRNYSFSLYAQRYDADNNPTVEDRDRIASLKTDSGGQAVIYVSPYNSYRPNQTGIYALKAKDSSNNYFTIYDIRILANSDYNFEQNFSGLSGKLSDAFNRVQAEKDIFLYEQNKSGSVNILGKQLIKKRTDSGGNFDFDYPAGTYALVVKDQFNQNNIFWNVKVNSGQNNYQSLTTNLTKLSFSQAQSGSISGDIYFKLYKLVSDNNSTFYRDKEVANLKLDSSRSITAALAANPYLAVYRSNSGSEFGKAFYAQNGKLQNITLGITRDYMLSAGQSFKLTVPGYTPSNDTPGASNSLSNKLKGKILLQVEDRGQAWYVNPANQKRYYMGRPEEAFDLMRNLGVGISNENLEKIPVADSNLGGNDSDGDGLSDEAEDSVGTNKYKADSDDDGHNDRTEVLNGYNPNGSGREGIDSSFAKSQAGRIFLQVERNGEAWYVNPDDNKRYFLKRPSDAFNVMRSLGLGITNTNLDQITSN